ncbi:MAG: diguanylate cyclase [Planctomycetaceae bacterium]
MIEARRIWTSSQLPTLPSVAAKLLELTKDPETEIRQVVDVIKSDPAITAKILKAANSSFFGLASEVRTIDRAVPLLGTTVATSLALCFTLSDDAMTKGPAAAHYLAYWKQSIVQAAAAETLAQRHNRAVAGEFFLCGLLLDIGQLAMLKTIPRQYCPVRDSVQELDRPLIECEVQSLGFSHVDIGSKLMEHWKLPAMMVQAAQRHHAPWTALAELKDQPHFELVVAMVAAAAIGDYFCTPFKGRALEQLRVLAGHCWQMTEADVDQLLADADERFKLAGDLFQVDLTSFGSPADLMVEANEQLAQIAVKEHLAGAQAAVKQQSAEAETRALQSHNEELKQQALRDPLTGLYNRHFFDETIAREFRACARDASPIGVLFADVDHFKKLNDTYGHQCGDEVLQRISKIFSDSIRGSDTVARFGGEEFVILVKQPTEKGLERIAERIREQIALEPFTFQQSRIAVTVSLGAAMTIPNRQGTDSPRELIAAADDCLYQSKHAGRNRVTITTLIEESERSLMQQVTAQRFSRWLVSKGLTDITAVSRALIECPPSGVRIGELAQKSGLLSAEQVDAVLRQQQASSSRFGQIACENGWLTRAQLAKLLAWQQEDPKQLASIVMRLGVMTPDAATAALEEYLQTVPMAAGAPVSV